MDAHRGQFHALMRVQPRAYLHARRSARNAGRTAESACGEAANSCDHSPLMFYHEVTQACDLVCEHCRASAQEDSRLACPNR